MLQHKELPPLRAEYLFPPVKDYVFFKDGAANPFRCDATILEPVNAWWLADASLLAYADGPSATEQFRKAGLEVVGGSPIERDNTQCYLFRGDGFVVAVFRGTEVLKPDTWDSLGDAWLNAKEAALDLRTDAKFSLVKAKGSADGFVHRGFQEALDGVWPLVDAALSEARSRDPHCTVWFSGHSLGAALATLAATRHPDASGLYTYGSPRVGDAAFARSLQVPAYRFVNNNDIVPRIPIAGHRSGPEGGIEPYEHAGDLLYITPKGDIRRNPGRGRRFWYRLQGYAVHYRHAIGALLHGEPWALAPDALNDHAPILYAIHTWNEYVRSQQG